MIILKYDVAICTRSNGIVPKQALADGLFTYSVLDLAATNAWVLYKEVTSKNLKKKINLIIGRRTKLYNEEPENTFMPLSRILKIG